MGFFTGDDFGLLYLGTADDDVAFLLGGNDTAFGDTGDDSIDGGGGNDVLFGEEGDDRLYSGSGNDQLFGGDGQDFLYGGSGNDVLLGELGRDYLYGGDGFDIVAYNGADSAVLVNLATGQASGGEGADVLDSIERVDGSQFDDEFTGDGFANTLNGNGGNDTLDGAAGADTLNGGGGNDSLRGGAGADLMIGGTANDTYYVDELADQVIEATGGGTDTVYATASYTLGAGQEVEILRASSATGVSLIGNELTNTLIGAAGDDTLDGAAGNDTLDGGLGKDTLKGGVGADIMTGGAASDIYYVDELADQVIEATRGGTDRVHASASYTLGAGQAVEILRASSATGVSLTGNELRNTLIGAAGNDTLDGGLGRDMLKGGVGADTFAFSAPLGWSNADAIVGFGGLLDSIQLDHLVCPGLTVGTLDASQFAVNIATGTGPQIVYNDVSGVLTYDGNGGLSGGATRFATLEDGPVLAASDFTVI